MCGVDSAHAMDASAGGSGGAAEVDLWRGGSVEAAGGAEEELTQVGCAANDVAADEVGVHGLKRGGGEDVTGEDTVAEARGEALDLGFEAWEHVLG